MGGPPRWTSTDQLEWLRARVGRYFEHQASGDQIEFFARLDEAWNTLSPAEQERLGAALEQRKKQLRTWFRNQSKKQRESGDTALQKNDKDSLKDALWKDVKRHRAPQLVEVYQKLYPDRVRDGLKAAGYDKKHASDLEWVSVDGERPADEAKTKAILKQQASERMKLRREVSKALLEGETAEVKKAVEVEARSAKAKMLEALNPVERTPESTQSSLDQMEAIVSRFHEVLREKTGWVGFTVVGGPTPNAGGALGMQTAGGHTFKDSHPDWKAAVGTYFVDFLKRCFTRSDRDAMALVDAEDGLDGLLPMDSDDEDVPLPPLPTKAKKTQAKKAPKRPKKTDTPRALPKSTTNAESAAVVDATNALDTPDLRNDTHQMPSPSTNPHGFNWGEYDTHGAQGFNWGEYDTLMEPTDMGVGEFPYSTNEWDGEPPATFTTAAHALLSYPAPSAPRSSPPPVPAVPVAPATTSTGAEAAEPPATFTTAAHTLLSYPAPSAPHSSPPPVPAIPVAPATTSTGADVSSEPPAVAPPAPSHSAPDPLPPRPQPFMFTTAPPAAVPLLRQPHSFLFTTTTAPALVPLAPPPQRPAHASPPRPPLPPSQPPLLRPRPRRLLPPQPSPLVPSARAADPKATAPLAQGDIATASRRLLGAMSHERENETEDQAEDGETSAWGGLRDLGGSDDDDDEVALAGSRKSAHLDFPLSPKAPKLPKAPKAQKPQRGENAGVTTTTTTRPLANPPKAPKLPKAPKAQKPQRGEDGGDGRGAGRRRGRGRGRGRGVGGAEQQQVDDEGGSWGEEGSEEGEGPPRVLADLRGQWRGYSASTGHTASGAVQATGEGNPGVREGEDAKESETDKGAKNKAAPDNGVYVVPRLPGAPMPPIPQLGRPTRARRPPVDANEQAARLDAKLLQQLERKGEGSKKRKAVTEVDAQVDAEATKRKK
ncbi:hypothetical protein B0H12DRAFT_1239236 [Mycena haematopus]|nr:hypothetical protein B0H12DRAFT_1239236 [Mycena haematopus]